MATFISQIVSKSIEMKCARLISSMRRSYPGFVTADIIEVRFAFAGRISAVNKHYGEKVKQWDLISSLDKKILQAELDKELADYERARANFDKATTVEKQLAQIALNISVKNVELAKMRLDSADLISPIEGMVLDNGGLRPGMNITPASNPIKILDISSYRFEFEITQNDLEKFSKPREVLISFFKGTKDDVSAQTLPPVMGSKGKFIISAQLPKLETILPGLEGEASA